MILHVDMDAFYASGDSQPGLFDEDERRHLSRLDDVTDRIAARFGGKSIGRGTGLENDP